MAKVKRSPTKGLREIDSIPAIPESAEYGMTERQNILDHALPIGAYALDAVVTEMLTKSKILLQTTQNQLVRHARIVADVSAWSSIRQARNELSEKSRRSDAKFLLAQLQDMSTAARALRRIRPEEVAPLIARDDDVDYPDDEVKRANRSVQFAEATAEELLEKVAALNIDLEHFLKRYKLEKGGGSSSEPLTNWYIFNCASFWHGLTGEWVRQGDCSDFRRFLIASWTDLKLPNPTDRNGAPKPLEDHFRDRLAKSDVFLKFRGN